MAPTVISSWMSSLSLLLLLLPLLLPLLIPPSLAHACCTPSWFFLVHEVRHHRGLLADLLLHCPPPAEPPVAVSMEDLTAAGAAPAGGGRGSWSASGAGAGAGSAPVGPSSGMTPSLALARATRPSPDSSKICAKRSLHTLLCPVPVNLRCRMVSQFGQCFVYP